MQRCAACLTKGTILEANQFGIEVRVVMAIMRCLCVCLLIARHAVPVWIGGDGEHGPQSSIRVPAW